MLRIRPSSTSFSSSGHVSCNGARAKLNVLSEFKKATLRSGSSYLVAKGTTNLKFSRDKKKGVFSYSGRDKGRYNPNPNP